MRHRSNPVSEPSADAAAAFPELIEALGTLPHGSPSLRHRAITLCVPSRLAAAASLDGSQTSLHPAARLDDRALPSDHGMRTVSGRCGSVTIRSANLARTVRQAPARYANLLRTCGSVSERYANLLEVLTQRARAVRHGSTGLTHGSGALRQRVATVRDGHRTLPHLECRTAARVVTLAPARPPGSSLTLAMTGREMPIRDRVPTGAPASRESRLIVV